MIQSQLSIFSYDLKDKTVNHLFQHSLLQTVLPSRAWKMVHMNSEILSKDDKFRTMSEKEV